jgi:hypothetical protein
MRIKILSKIYKDNQGKYFFDFDIGSRTIAHELTSLSEEKLLEGETRPILAPDLHQFIIYKNHILSIEGFNGSLDEENVFRIKHLYFIKEKGLNKIRKEVEAFENLDTTRVTKRERLSDTTRLFVWQRDGGRCVKCGKKEKLEFDHIIPVAEGGANTVRNIQLLCEGCNRTKGKNI